MLRRSCVSVAGALVLCLLTIRGADPPATAGVARLRVGDPSPAVAPPGAPGRPSSGVEIVAFWATWCPASRAILTRVDSLMGGWSSRGVRLLAVSAEPPETLERFLATAGWSRIEIVSDTGGGRRRAFLDAAGRGGPLPYAFILGEADTTALPSTTLATRRLLWSGPIRFDAGGTPGAGFMDAIGSILAGTYDVDAAATRLVRLERLGNVVADVRAAHAAGDLDALGRVLDELTELVDDGSRSWDGAPAATEALNGVAWNLVTDGTPSARTISLGRHAVEIALALGGDGNAAIVDTYARALHESGEAAAAFEAQRRAVEMARGTGLHGELLATLRGYADGLGAEADSVASAAGEPGGASAPGPEDGPVSAPSDARPGPWRGTLNDVHAGFDRAADIVLVPPAPPPPGDRAAWDDEIGGLRESLFAGSAVLPPDSMTLERRRGKVLVLYGTPDDNPLTREVLAYHGIELVADGVRVGGQRLPVANPFVIAALPSPWRPSLPVIVYAASADSVAHGLNRVFHGPTAIVLGGVTDRGPRALVATGLRFGDSVATGVDPDRVTGLTIGGRILTAAEAAEDLDELHELLHYGYAGYDDIEWTLRGIGSSWARRTEAFRERLRSRPEWDWEGFFELCVEYLDHVQDFHFQMTGTGDGADGIVSRSARLVDALAVHFTDVRVRPVDGVPRLGYPDDGSGAELLDVPIADDPSAVEAGVPYLFPTLDLVAGETGRLFLLGVMSPADDEPPGAITVRVRRPDGQVEPLDLSLHRGRVGLARGGDAWRLTGTPSPLPVLAVRTMSESRLAGFVETADSLRTLPRLVLDLRANGGGSDTPAIRWCSRFSGQRYRWECVASMEPGEPDPARRWTSTLDRWLDEVVPASVDAAAPSPYPGKLFVLIDRGVASSGETLAMLAGQIPGAVLVGENTAGCTSYGNVEVHGPLPHSGIELRFGRTRFVVECVRPTREGVGFFPDYWLDADDPVGTIAAVAGADGE